MAALIAAGSAIGLAAIGAFHAIKLAQLKDHINSRMDEMIRVVKAEAHAVGKLEGKAEQREESRVERLTEAMLSKPIDVVPPTKTVNVPSNE